MRIRFRDRDAARIPARWLRADSRALLLTGAPRVATAPINSTRNYLFACLESEARLALLVYGCDPTMGVLHADQRNRDTFALDAIEVVRAEVDAFLLDLLEDRIFIARDFGELPNGICRLAAPLAHELALTLPHWRECLRPIVAGLAQTFREAQAGKTTKARLTLRSSRTDSRKKFLAAHSHAAKGSESEAVRAENCANSAPRSARIESYLLRVVRRGLSSSVGAAIARRAYRARRECGLRAIEAARKALAAQAAGGNDPRVSDKAGRKCGEAISEQHRQNRAWARHASADRDAAWFLREIVPKLDAYSLSQIARATGLSLAACSRIRAGTCVPHPRHWEALKVLSKE